MEAARAPRGNILTINFSNCCKNNYLRGAYESTWQKQLWSFTTHTYSSTVLRLIFQRLPFSSSFSIFSNFRISVTLQFDARVLTSRCACGSLHTVEEGKTLHGLFQWFLISQEEPNGVWFPCRRCFNAVRYHRSADQQVRRHLEGTPRCSMMQQNAQTLLV